MSCITSAPPKAVESLLQGAKNMQKVLFLGLGAIVLVAAAVIMVVSLFVDTETLATALEGGDEARHTDAKAPRQLPLDL